VGPPAKRKKSRIQQDDGLVERQNGRR
jgi:hypothetical protein